MVIEVVEAIDGLVRLTTLKHRFFRDGMVCVGVGRSPLWEVKPQISYSKQNGNLFNEELNLLGIIGIFLLFFSTLLFTKVI